MGGGACIVVWVTLCYGLRKEVSRMSEYDQKVKDILDTDTYTRLKKNPIPLAERKGWMARLGIRFTGNLRTPTAT